MNNKKLHILSISVISIIFIFTIVFAYGLSKSQFDYDFEKFFAPNDKETDFYENYRNEFENDYDFLLIGLKNKTSIYDTAFLYRVNQLADTLKSLQNVTNVLSPTQIKIPVLGAGGYFNKKLLSFNSTEKTKKDSIYLNESKELFGSFISTDQKSVCLLLNTKVKMAKKPSDKLIGEIESIVNSFQFHEHYLAGKIKAQQVYLDKMQGEIVLFLALAIILVVVFLGITFQNFWHVIIPIVTVLLSIIWQLGFMYFLGKKIDILTVLVPTILFVVGMSDVIHFIAKYLEELRNGHEKVIALRKSLKDIGFATFLTSFTTALGFVTLYTSNLVPIQEFGLYTALGVMIAYVLAITLMPSIMLLLPTPKLVNNKKYTDWWYRFLHRQLLFVFKYPKYIISFFVLATIILFLGVTKIRVNNLLLEDLSPKEPMKINFKFFEDNFSGGRPFEMKIEVNDKNKTVLDYEVIQELVKLEYISKITFELGFVQSPLNIIKTFNRSLNSGLNDYYKIPQTKIEYDKVKQSMLLSGILSNEFILKIIHKDLRKCRISGKMHDLGSYKVNQMEREFDEVTSQNINKELISFQLTGSARLVDKNISNLSRNLLQGLSIAIIIVAIAFGLMLRSIRMMIISLIPNLIPMIAIAGIMGFSGTDIKVSTSIIFTIAFGIAVDDTIHFLSRYKIELKNGYSKLYAIKRSFLNTGKAMILTSLVLCAGFVTMISSSFMSIFYVGFLLSLTLFIALLADLYLLPLLIMYMGKGKSKNVKY